MVQCFKAGIKGGQGVQKGLITHPTGGLESECIQDVVCACAREGVREGPSGWGGGLPIQRAYRVESGALTGPPFCSNVCNC